MTNEGNPPDDGFEGPNILVDGVELDVILADLDGKSPHKTGARRRTARPDWEAGAIGFFIREKIPPMIDVHVAIRKLRAEAERDPESWTKPANLPDDRQLLAALPDLLKQVAGVTRQLAKK